MRGMSETNPITAATLVIGNEILSGRTADVNIVTIARKLSSKGIILAEVRVVPDIEAMIVEALNELRGKYTYVLTTGGIGPTHDDITMPSIAKAFGVPLIEMPEVLEALSAYYGREQMNGARRRMAMMPEGSVLVKNPVTASPGVRLDNVFALAGVPEIMRGMLEAVIDVLDEGRKVHVRTVRCLDVVESLIADELSALADKNSDVEIGSYPAFQKGRMGLSFVIRGFDSARVDAVTQDAATLLTSQGGHPEITPGY